MTFVYIIGALLAIAGMIYWRKTVYEQGVWDGAFNQFLPDVRKAILDYDERRGAEILQEFDAKRGREYIEGGSE